MLGLKSTKFNKINKFKSAQMPTPPDVLLNLKFEADESTDAPRDFVNVADLDSEAIEHILKLIENNQNNRVKKQPKPSSKPSEITPTQVISEMENQGDELTHQILDLTQANKDAAFKQYDEIMERRIAAERERARLIGGKQRAVDELEVIDERIRAINRIADGISDDYTRLGKFADKLSDLVDLREIAEKRVDEYKPMLNNESDANLDKMAKPDSSRPQTSKSTSRRPKVYFSNFKKLVISLKIRKKKFFF